MKNLTMNKKVKSLKRKGAAAVEIAIDSAMATISHDGSTQLAMGVGLIQGLKYRGDFKRGIKAGATTMGVLVTADVVRNVAKNWEYIKNA